MQVLHAALTFNIASDEGKRKKIIHASISYFLSFCFEAGFMSTSLVYFQVKLKKKKKNMAGRL